MASSEEHVKSVGVGEGRQKPDSADLSRFRACGVGTFYRHLQVSSFLSKEPGSTVTLWFRLRDTLLELSHPFAVAH